MSIENLHEVVEKLIGPISPIGCSQADNERFNNLVAATELVDKLVDSIEQIRDDRNSHMASVKRAGQHAHNFLNDFDDVVIKE